MQIWLIKGLLSKFQGTLYNFVGPLFQRHVFQLRQNILCTCISIYDIRKVHNTKRVFFWQYVRSWAQTQESTNDSKEQKI